MRDDFTLTQKRALAVLTVIALAFAAYFLRTYLLLIAISAVLAYLFTPLNNRLLTRMGSGAAATVTLLAAIATVALPLSGVAFLAFLQISQMVTGISQWVERTDFTALGQRLLDSANQLLARIPFIDTTLTPESVRDALATIGQKAGEFALGFARDSVGGIVAMVTALILFIYVFLALLTNGTKVLDLFRDLNPLGQQVSDIYLAKVGAMVSATVKGQFIIAVCQGVAGAVSVYIGGIHDGFFMFVIFLTVLSFIPLGGGIVTIPLGIGMAVFGNPVGGIFVIVFHIIVVTNIDNLLRPFLVPKSAHLHPALMLLAVFAGLQMFGFIGIVLGPVLMIVIVTTISVYLVVYKDAPMESITGTGGDPADDDAVREIPWWRRLLPGKPKPAPEPAKSAAP
ncbi:AI-2E family transporter [Mycolicibacterium sp. jd]|jgi:predicted PurR-regulated permease PerM|uniref:AI-2E family transporter n=1 Tax=Mycolicibacterium TaxID=1866885 RepID=UPI001F49138C|nr:MULTISPECIES: AI-2E family transporter [Mycolicibacterium]MDW5612943.1 AI-2E family transporter [Mycolicibacterium sp. D5.8-2]UJL28759.1 AI-2E family transporter [Mycolicibacterium vanbaalenii]WND55470.1 AI-2E family transporter [Mycolicibacterium vanbaalenii]